MLAAVRANRRGRFVCKIDVIALGKRWANHSISPEAIVLQPVQRLNSFADQRRAGLERFRQGIVKSTGTHSVNDPSRILGANGLGNLWQQIRFAEQSNLPVG